MNYFGINKTIYEKMPVLFINRIARVYKLYFEQVVAE